MIHKTRVYQIAEEISDIVSLAESLTHHTRTLCTAFKLVTSPDAEPLLFLNDSFSENGAKKYAVVQSGRQIESITFSWCSRAEAYNHIDWLVRGGGDDYGPVGVLIEPADNHRRAHCR